MVDTLKLKAQIIVSGKTQKEVYETMGLSKRQWNVRMKRRKFDSDEMYELCSILRIDDPKPIFFAD